MTNPLINQKGQSFIEAAVVAVALWGFISLFLGTLYLLYASYWVEHIMYETLICQQESGRTQYCVVMAREKIQSILFLKNTFTIRMFSNKVKVQMSIDPPFVDPLTFSFSKGLKV